MASNTSDNPVKIAGKVAQTYAESLWDLAVEADVVDEVAEELAQIVSLVEEQPQLRAMFDSPSIKAERRARSIKAIFEGKVSSLTYRFLQVVNDKGRLDQLPGIRIAFDQRLKAERGEVDVDVYTAQPLSDSQKASVASKVSASIGRNAVVTAHLDESMLGGLKLRIGDKLIDGSVATQLNKMKRKMIARGRERVRADASALLEENEQ
jgi:F-type H+-transporting ATPase subunit delta